jgi:hypothetical protein
MGYAEFLRFGDGLIKAPLLKNGNLNYEGMFSWVIDGQTFKGTHVAYLESMIMKNSNLEYTAKVFQEDNEVVYKIMKGERLVARRNISVFDCGFFRCVFLKLNNTGAIKAMFKLANKECMRHLAILEDQEKGV